MKAVSKKILSMLIILTLVVSSSGLAFATETEGGKKDAKVSGPKAGAVVMQQQEVENQESIQKAIERTANDSSLSSLKGATQGNNFVIAQVSDLEDATIDWAIEKSYATIKFNIYDDKVDSGGSENTFCGYSQQVYLKEGTLIVPATLVADGEYYAYTYFGLFEDADMNYPIGDLFEVDESSEEVMLGTFTVPADGYYYIGTYTCIEDNDAINYTLDVATINLVSGTIGDEGDGDIEEVTPEYSLSESSITIYEKETSTLEVEVTPEYLGVEDVTWSSSNTSVATVSSTGVVTAKAKGTATVTAKVGDQTLTCKVTVKAMAISATSATVYVKKTKTLKIYGGTGNATWKSSKKSVATVTSSGVVKGIKPGTATITGKKNGKTFKCKVTVKWEPETGTVKNYEYDLPYGGNEYEKIVLKGKSTVKINAYNYEGEDSLYVVFNDNDYDEKWSKFIYEGESATKTLTLSKGTYYLYYDTTSDCHIDVKVTTAAQLSRSSMTVARGYKRDLDAVAVKNGGTWSSSNTKIATVSSSGNVKGKKNGTCYIKYKMKTGKVLKCKVTVKTPVTCKVTWVRDVPIYNDCYVKFTNNTGKKISYIKLNIKQYNSRSKRLSSPYSYYYVDDYLPAYSSDEWYFWVNNSAKKCKATITKVYFTDGTTWKP